MIRYMDYDPRRHKGVPVVRVRLPNDVQRQLRTMSRTDVNDIVGRKPGGSADHAAAVWDNIQNLLSKPYLEFPSKR